MHISDTIYDDVGSTWRTQRQLTAHLLSITVLQVPVGFCYWGRRSNRRLTSLDRSFGQIFSLQNLLTTGSTSHLWLGEKLHFYWPAKPHGESVDEVNKSWVSSPSSSLSGDSLYLRASFFLALKDMDASQLAYKQETPDVFLHRLILNITLYQFRPNNLHQLSVSLLNH